MLVAFRLAGLSALEIHYGGVVAHAQSAKTGAKREFRDVSRSAGRRFTGKASRPRGLFGGRWRSRSNVSDCGAGYPNLANLPHPVPCEIGAGRRDDQRLDPTMARSREALERRPARPTPARLRPQHPSSIRATARRRFDQTFAREADQSAPHIAALAADRIGHMRETQRAAFERVERSLIAGPSLLSNRPLRPGDFEPLREDRSTP